MSTKSQIKKNLEQTCYVEDKGRILVGKYKDKDRSSLPHGITCESYTNPNRWFELWREGDVERVDRTYNYFRDKFPDCWPFFVFFIPTWYEYDANPQDEQEVVEKLVSLHWIEWRNNEQQYKIEDGKVFVKNYNGTLCSHDDRDILLDRAMKHLGVNENEVDRIKGLVYKANYPFICSGIDLQKFPDFLNILFEIGNVCERIGIKDLDNVFTSKSRYDPFSSDLMRIAESYRKYIFQTLQEVYGPRLIEECDCFESLRISGSNEGVIVKFEFYKSHYSELPFEKVYNMADAVTRAEPLLRKYQS